MDERKFVEGRLLLPLKNAKIVVVGSSRLMQINSDIIGEPLINLTVSGATIEDDIAFTLEASTKLNANHVYIAADPWLINKFDGQNRYKSQIEYLYEYWLDNVEQSKPLKTYFVTNKKKLEEQLNWGLLQSIRRGLHPTSHSIPKDGKIEAIAKKAYDGSHVVTGSFVDNSKDISQDLDVLLNYAMSQFEHDIKAEKIKSVDQISTEEWNKCEFDFVTLPPRYVYQDGLAKTNIFRNRKVV